MASMVASSAMRTPVVGLGDSNLRLRRSNPTPLRSSFLRPVARTINPLGSHGNARVTCFNRDWLRKDLSVIGFGLIGWLAPSSIPAINGDSLTGLFFSSIGTELAHFPTGPALTSPFWLWLATWHFGLFVVLTFGQIGFKGRKDAYW